MDNEYSRDANARLREIAVKELTLFFSFLDKLDVVVVESKSWLAYLEEHRRGKDSSQTSAHSVKGVVVLCPPACSSSPHCQLVSTASCQWK